MREVNELVQQLAPATPDWSTLLTPGSTVVHSSELYNEVRNRDSEDLIDISRRTPATELFYIILTLSKPIGQCYTAKHNQTLGSPATTTHNGRPPRSRPRHLRRRDRKLSPFDKTTHTHQPTNLLPPHRISAVNLSPTSSPPSSSSQPASSPS